MNCLNCNAPVSEKFCSNCGQKRDTKPYTLKKVSEDIIGAFTDDNRGILFNLKNLSLKPEKSINGYIEGKRKLVFNPFSYLILAIGTYIFLSHWCDFSLFKSSNPSKETISFAQNINKGGYAFGYNSGRFMTQYLKFFFILNVIYLSLITYLVLKRRNFIEHVVMNSFIVGHAVIIGIIVIPIFNFPLPLNPVILISIGTLMFFTYKTYEEKIVLFSAIFFGILVMLILQFLIPGLIGFLI